MKPFIAEAQLEASAGALVSPLASSVEPLGQLLPGRANVFLNDARLAQTPNNNNTQISRGLYCCTLALPQPKRVTMTLRNEIYRRTDVQAGRHRHTDSYGVHRHTNPAHQGGPPRVSSRVVLKQHQPFVDSMTLSEFLSGHSKRFLRKLLHLRTSRRVCDSQHECVHTTKQKRLASE